VKFSVVIPTHNRLDLLSDAIQTVLRQDQGNWELVIFDNASTDDIAGHVAGLSDSRIRYARSDEFLPVTDSWNRAIELASGDYVVFLGDDDGLAPGFFSGMSAIIRQFQSPEVVYCALYQFLHPGVAPWDRGGYVADVKNGFFFAGRNAPFVLTPKDAQKAVNGSIALRRNFTFNIQAFTFGRGLLARLREQGPIFRSPFPDYYLANIALAKARSTVIVPSAMSIAGVSKASFGFTLFNDLEEKGAQILNANLTKDPLYGEVEKFLLPGPLYNTNYAVTMEHVARQAGSFVGRGVDYGRYRRLQLFALLGAGKGRLSGVEGGADLWSRLTAFEKLWTWAISAALLFGRLVGLEAQLRRVLQRLLSPYGFQPKPLLLDRGSFTRLIQIFDAIQNRAFEKPRRQPVQPGKH